MLCVSGEFFLIFIVKCEKFVIVRRMCRFGARLCGAAGGRALQPDNIAHSGEEKKKFGVCAVTMFSSLRTFGRITEEGGREQQRHFPGNRPIFYILTARTPQLLPRSARQHERRTSA